MEEHVATGAETDQAPRLSLAGRTALITGAGRGIGAGIVEVFLEAGATVVANALGETHLAKLGSGLPASQRARFVPMAGDAATAAGAADLIARVTAEVGELDILVNGVGDAIVGDLVAEASEAEAIAQIQSVIDLNLMSAIHCTRLVGQQMIRRKRGRVISLTAVTGGVLGEAKLSIYSAGKAGVIGFTRSLAREWAQHGITVNAIAPGVLPDRENLAPEHYAMIEDAFLRRIPVGRFGMPRELGYLACYLASDLSAYLTGQVLAFDGGLSA